MWQITESKMKICVISMHCFNKIGGCITKVNKYVPNGFINFIKCNWQFLQQNHDHILTETSLSA